MKFKAGNSDEYDSVLANHKDRSLIVVKDNQIVSANCFKDTARNSIDYQRLVGFATLEKALQPANLDEFNKLADQRYLTWVEGSANLKDIVWKSVHGLNSYSKVN